VSARPSLWIAVLAGVALCLRGSDARAAESGAVVDEPATARADATGDAARAEAAAFADVDAHRWCDAVNGFMRAYTLAPAELLLFNAALAAEKAGDAAQARELFARVPAASKKGEAARRHLADLARAPQKVTCTPVTPAPSSDAVAASSSDAPTSPVASASSGASSSAASSSPASSAAAVSPPGAAPRPSGPSPTTTSPPAAAARKAASTTTSVAKDGAPADVQTAAPTETSPTSTEGGSVAPWVAIGGGALVAIAGAAGVIVGAGPYFDHERAHDALVAADHRGVDPTSSAVNELQHTQASTGDAWNTWGQKLVIGGAVAAGVGVVAAGVGAALWITDAE
jgi:hypothetical protein